MFSNVSCFTSNFLWLFLVLFHIFSLCVQRSSFEFKIQIKRNIHNDAWHPQFAVIVRINMEYYLCECGIACATNSVGTLILIWILIENSFLANWRTANCRDNFYVYFVIIIMDVGRLILLSSSFFHYFIF